MSLAVAARLAEVMARNGVRGDFAVHAQTGDAAVRVLLHAQVREALLDVVKEMAPRAWVRQCGSVETWPPQIWDYKTRILDALSRKFRELAGERSIATNPAFAGAYDFSRATEADFARLFPRFLRGLPARSVVMCHPGFVDAELERLDPLTTQREREYAYLAGEAFPAAMRAHGVALA